MQVKRYQEIVITNPIVVNFLSDNASNEYLLKACDELIESFCKTTKEFIEHNALMEKNKCETNQVITYLQEFEKRHVNLYDSINTKFDILHTNIDVKLCNAATTVSEKVNAQLSSLIVAIQQTVSSALDRLNVETILNSLTDVVQSTIAHSLNMSVEDTRNRFFVFETQLKERMESYLIQPLISSNNKLLVQLSSLPEMIKGRDVDIEDIIKHIEMLKAKVQNDTQIISMSINNLENQVNSKVQHFFDKIQDNKDMSIEQQRRITNQIESLPLLTKSVIGDVLRDLDGQSKKMLICIESIRSEIDAVRESIISTQISLAGITTHTAAVHEKVNDVEKQLLIKTTKDSLNTKLKGSDGEDRIFMMLSERLMSRDGWSIEQVNGQARSCDLVVKRNGYPPVRVESKAHGQGTNEKVRSSEVDKFKRDLMTVDNHGIFVSLYSGIVGIGNFEIQQLSNGKFAIYLSNNNFDIDIIVDMIHLLHKLDSIIGSAKNDDCLRISTDSLSRLEECVKDYGMKIQSAKSHLKETVSLLNGIQLDMIERLLLGGKQNGIDHKDVIKCEHICDCGRTFGNKGALTTHRKTCSRGNPK